MGRKRKPDPLDQARRLMAVKDMIKDAADATPSMARELRRNAIETIDDIIGELATPARILKSAVAAAGHDSNGG
jgi:hypothetical protein